MDGIFRIFSRRTGRAQRNRSPHRQSSNIQPPPNEHPAFEYSTMILEDDELRQSETKSQSPVTDQLKILICASVLDIAENPAKRTLVSSLQSDDAQCMVDYLDQLLSEDSASELSARQRKYLLNLLMKVGRTAQVFPATRELCGVVCNLINPDAEGGFSFIYKGTYKGQKVCVKAIRRWLNYDEDQDRLVQAQGRELILWSRLSHPNVLPFHGVFHSGEELPRICIVSPWMENGDLSCFLKKFPLTPRMPLISDVIAGLRYLHELEVIHGDLKAKNILVSDDGRAMIADFGISSIAMTVPTHQQDSMGTTKWMAPELFEDEPRGTIQSDIWSFGCICYEVLTGNEPFSEFASGYQLVAAFVRSHMTPFSPGTRCDVAKKEAELQSIDTQMRSVLEECWQKDPRLRPTAEKLCNIIARIGPVDDRPPSHFGPQLINATRAEAKIDHERLYHILTHIIGNTTGSNEECSANSFSEVENDAYETSERTSGSNSNSNLPNVRKPIKPLSTPGSPTSVPENSVPALPSPSIYNRESRPTVKPNIKINLDAFNITGSIQREGDLFPKHSGGYSDIYVGFRVENPSFKVAIKVLRTVNEREAIETMKKNLFREVVVWHKLTHKNILPFLGLANNLGLHDCPALIAPYCSKGDTVDYIRRLNPTMETRQLLILGIAQGLEYLHGEDIVHGDLKPSNVLIDNNDQPLICDFGRAKFLGAPDFTRPAGSVRYQARELLEGIATRNKSTDVCAFGLTAFELWTSHPPYGEIHNEFAVLRHIILGDTQPKLPDPPPEMVESIWPILVPCFNYTPEDRPNMQSIRQHLESCPLSILS